MGFTERPTRRSVLIAAAGALGGGAVRAAPDPASEPVAMKVDAGQGVQIDVRRFAAPGTARRPAVLLLHGSRGLDARTLAYEHYAQSLAGAGIDVYLFSYYRPLERAAIAGAGSAAKREILYGRFIEGWVSSVRAVADHARRQDMSSGKVGLLGVSLGGIVAVAAASRPLFDALVVFYGGLPDFYRPAITSLPPLLEIHGSADQAVPIGAGIKLVDKARALGGTAEFVRYENEPHGFDFRPGNKDATGARQHAIDFLRAHLPAH